MSDWAAQEEAFFGEAVSAPTSKPKSTSFSQGNVRKNSRKEKSTDMIQTLKEKANVINHSAQDRFRQLSSSIPTQYPGASRNTPSFHSPPQNGCHPRESASPAPQPTNYLTPSYISNNPSPTIHSNDTTNTKSKWSKLLTTKVTKFQKHLTKHINETIRTHQCMVCGAFAPTPYRYHPFFPSERICAFHNESEVIKCTACQRFGPGVGSGREEFADLQDNDRKLCPACLRTVIVDSQDAIPLWSSVIEFLDIQLGAFFNPLDTTKKNGNTLENIKTQMKSIPILIVSHDGLNDTYIRGSGHGKGNTRGLCVYEYRQISTFLNGGKSIGGGRLKEFLDRKSKQSSTNIFQTVLTSFNTATSTIQQHMRSSRVTAILCLKGLPRDLVSSILAHEATHAWFKLHPNFNPSSPIPLQIEEGCCQLVAFLYLSHLERQYNAIANSDNCKDGDQPSNLKLCQYFRHCIETDTSEIYGDGFRLAAKAYAKCNSVATILHHVVIHRYFP